ncbi:MAG: AtpZ/AtpI family protein [Bacteroidota bacterium]
MQLDRQAGNALTLGWQLAGGLIVWCVIGFFLDRWLGTSPWLLIAGAGLGLVAFFAQVVRFVKEANEASESRKAGYRALREVRTRERLERERQAEEEAALLKAELEDEEWKDDEWKRDEE